MKTVAYLCALALNIWKLAFPFNLSFWQSGISTILFLFYLFYCTSCSLFNNCFAAKLLKTFKWNAKSFDFPMLRKWAMCCTTLIKPETTRAACIICQVQFDWHRIYSMQFDTELQPKPAPELAATPASGWQLWRRK